MSESKHIHKLKRITYKNGSKAFFCTLPDCFFKIGTQFALGKQSLCNRCGKPFIMNAYIIRKALPHCEDCHIHRADRRKNANHVVESVPIESTESIAERMARLSQFQSVIEEENETDLL